MKHNNVLTIASLLSILLLTLHITDDIVRGISKAEPSNIAWPFSWCCCTGRWCSPNGDRGTSSCCSSGCRGRHARHPHEGGTLRREIAKSTGGFFFVWTLWALGALGGFTFILSARGLWSPQWGQSRVGTQP